MTEYTRIDISKYENRDKTEWAVESMFECTLLCWLDDAQEHIRKLEDRIEKMQAAGCFGCRCFWKGIWCHEEAHI